MITTIQISDDVKSVLQKYKKSSKSTYEDVIKDLIDNYEKSQRDDIMVLREGYEEMYGLSQEVSDDWDDLDVDGLKENEY